MKFRERDARRVRTVTITAADRDAIRCSPTRCVVANAIRRQWGVDDVRVGAGIVSTLVGNVWTRWEMDGNSSAMVRAYDEQGDLLPAGVVVRLGPPHRPLGSRVGTKPGTNKRSGKHQSVATRRPSLRHVNVDPFQGA